MSDNEYNQAHNVALRSGLAGAEKSVGVIVIGRNEGERLRRAFSSLHLKEVAVLYVDSGSTDGSVELARSLGIDVHRLDPTRPFSPARGRAEGVERLLPTMPGLQYVQFLDGDCELAPEWLATAAAYLEQHPEVGVVCGMLVEAAPEASIYNRLSPQRWKLPAGEINACGGIFMIRRQVYEAVGGFNPELITREESDLCARVRAGGWRVVRLDTLMAKHDSGLLSFKQWWARAVWGGYGDALSIAAAPRSIESRRRLWWYLRERLAPLVLIFIGTAGIFWSPWFFVIIFLGVVIQGFHFARITFARLCQRDSFKNAIIFAFFSLLRSIASSFGFIQYHTRRNNRAKRPDPHTTKK